MPTCNSCVANRVQANVTLCENTLRFVLDDQLQQQAYRCAKGCDEIETNLRAKDS